MTLDVTIITGMSGAGRSAAADVLEDLGFFVIDNLPPALVTKVAELGAGHRRSPALRARHRRAFGRVRRRSRRGTGRAARDGREHAGPVPRRRRRRARASLRGEPSQAPARRRRTRVGGHRRRAAAPRRPQGPGRHRASTPATSTCTSCATGSRELFDADHEAGALQTSIVSFGYKHGLPIDVDLVFDCRFLPNPHWVDELRPLAGHRPQRPRLRAGTAGGRRRSSTSWSGCSRCCSPRTCARASRTSRSAIGCTGGRHRSVVIATELARLLEPLGVSPTCPPPRRRAWLTASRDGQRVVALGGGHGLATALRAVRRYAGRSPRS